MLGKRFEPNTIYLLTPQVKKKINVVYTLFNRRHKFPSRLRQENYAKLVKELSAVATREQLKVASFFKLILINFYIKRGFHSCKSNNLSS